MDQKYFRIPFAENGDKTAIPDDLQPSGEVSYDQGYGFDYERELGVDPDAKAIERFKMNDLLNAITEAVKQYQEFGAPEFITTADNDGVPFSYSKDAMVRYRALPGDPFITYESLVDANTSLPTDATKWRKYGYTSTLSGNPIIEVRGDGYVKFSGFVVINTNASGIGSTVVNFPFPLTAVKSAQATGHIQLALLGQGFQGVPTNVTTSSITLGAKASNSSTLRVDWSVEGVL